MAYTKQKKLKIGVLVDQLVLGGVQKMAIEDVKNCISIGHEAKLLVLMREGFKKDFAKLASGVQVEFLSDRYPKIFSRSIKFPVFSFFSTLHVLSPFLAPRYLRKNEFDAIISHGTTTCFTAQALRRKLDIPYIAVIHDPMEYILTKCYSETFLKYFFPLLKPILFHLEKNLIRESQQVLIVSKVHEAFLRKTYHINPLIFPFGSYPLDALPEKRGDYILSFSRWEKGKNPLLLLQLLEALPEAKLKIAGTWTSESDYKWFNDEIRRKKLSQRVEVIPFYTEEELRILCQNARVWVHPHFEAFGVGGLEAASCGCPIIIPAGSGVSELFEHGKHGYFPQEIHLSAYKKYVETLLSDERLAWKMGSDAYQKIRDRYSWRTRAKRLVRIIEGSSRTMNILALETGHALGTSLSGGDKLLPAMAVRMPKQFTFTIIIPRIGSWHWQELDLHCSLEILPQNMFDDNGSPVPVSLTYLIRMWQTVWRLVATKNVQIIYSSTNILTDIFPVFLYKLLFPQKKWMARIHHLIPSPSKRPGRFIVNVVSFSMQQIALYCIKTKADMIVALNEGLYNDLRARGFDKKNVKILGAGIEFEQIDSFKPASKNGYEAVFLGRLHVTKGIFDVIEIWGKVLRSIPDAKVAIIGGGPQVVSDQLQELIKSKGLQKNVFLLGYISTEEVLTVLKNSQMFLFTDHEAGWGLAAAEAMACKLPVIGYDIGVLGDIYKKGYMIVKLGDLEGFSRKVVSLIKQKNKKEKLSRDAYEQAKLLDWSETTRKFVRLLYELNGSK